jgi:UDP-N-acetylmuramate dehydrogenase
MQKAEKSAIYNKMDACRASRKAMQPRGKSMGCIFKNPMGISAGALIDKLGLKGKRIGGAIVSDIHANFIINDNNATSEDIKSLIKYIKTEVYAKSGVTLEEEIQYIGES